MLRSHPNTTLSATSCRIFSLSVRCCGFDMDVKFMMHIHRNGFSLRNASAVISGGMCMNGHANNQSLNLLKYASASSGVGSGRLSTSFIVDMFLVGGKSDMEQSYAEEHKLGLLCDCDRVGSAVAAAANESNRLGNDCVDVPDNEVYECAVRGPGSWVALSIETRSSIFSSSCAVRDDGVFLPIRFLIVAIWWHSLPRRWHLSQLAPPGFKMHLHFAREQLVQERP